MLRGLFLLLSAGLLSGCVSEALELVDDMRTQARIGVVANAEVGWITETQMLEKAFRFYRRAKVDAVVVTGKVTKNGYKAQYEVLDAVWKKVFSGTATRLVVKDGRYEVNGFPFAVAARRPAAVCDVLTFHGEGKRALTDELCFHPHDSNLVNAGSLNGIEVSETFVNAADVARRVSRAAQGLLVTVTSGEVRIRRLDFTQNGPPGVASAEDVAEPWIVGVETDRPPAPRFWDDTRLLVSVREEKGEAVYVLRWPSVQKRFTGARAWCYQVGVAFADEPTRVMPYGNVLSERFHLAEERDTQGVTCTIRGSLLARASDVHKAVFFTVTPLGAYGKRGNAVASEPVPLRR